MKMNAVMFFILIVCFAQVANASDFKMIGGKEYKDATVKRVEPDGIVLVTKWGISKIYFTELPKEIQDRFAYDAAESRSSTAKQDTRPELIPTNQAAQQPTEAATQPLPSRIRLDLMRLHWIAPMRSHEIM
jgi:hypothetical protein